MELTFTQQSTAFLFSLLLGLFLGAFYEAFRLLRLCFNFGKAGTIISDILFMLCSSVSVFLFSLAFLLGFVRIYVIAGCFTGFLFFKLTVGRILAKIYCPVISFVRKISRKIRKKIKIFTKKLLKNGYKILYNISKKIRIFGKVPQSAADDIRVMDSNEKEKHSVKKFSGSSKSRKQHNKGNKA
ncbi:spore cortex biosynthesis protein YabQ [Ruminococcus sp.]|uniref:spore cortex biosynthesis protein YabQ n=1 Tax=Ruminococcus sp. TaxID=41978 RepID=UPI003F0DEA8E